MANYWDKVLGRRLGRRRTVAATGGFALGAALLIACGGGSEGGKAPRQKASGLIYTPEDTTKQAKRGGVFRSYRTVEPLNFDLMNFAASLQPFSNVVGSELLKLKPGHLEDPSLQVEGDLAESWEMSPDKLTLTMKLNPNAKWSPLSNSFHDGMPASARSVANRTVDADDVAFSWDRFKVTSTANGRLDLFNELVPSAPVQSLTRVDARTIQFKMVRPFVPILTTLARPNVGYFYILPKEGANGGIDFIRYQVGAGPFYIDRFEPSVGMTLKRNPNFELRDTDFKRPYVDSVELPLVTEIAQQLAQYRAGNIFIAPTSATLGTDEVIKLKRDFPEHLLYTNYTSQGEVFIFGSAKDSPFKDVRARQAMSYAWDRDLLIQVLLSTEKLESEGIPAEIRWNAAMPCNEGGWPNGTYKGWWLDPKGKEFGENAKYFTLGSRDKDLTEAKKLLSAAGFASGAPFDYHIQTTASSAAQRVADVLLGMISEAGFKGAKKLITVPEFLEMLNDRRPKGDFSGMIQSIDPTAPDPGTYLFQLYNKNGTGGGGFQGYNPNSTGPSPDGDPFVNDLTDKLLTEFDEKKRVSMVYEFTRYHAKMNYRPRNAGGANIIFTAWPALANHRTYLGDTLKRDWSWEWLDTTKAPLNKN